jgi:hypothetical protein
MFSICSGLIIFIAIGFHLYYNTFMTKLEYSVEMAETMTGIEDRVHIRHGQGWRLQGGLSVVYNNECNKYYQAMIRETPEDYGLITERI